MTETTDGRRSELDRNLALLGYGLLFAAVFFAGIPALIAVIIAYSQRGETGAPLRSHYDFQIRIFWVGFVLTMIAAACAIAAVLIGIGEFLEFSMAGGFDAWDNIVIDMDDVRIDASVVILTVSAIIASLLTAIWLVAAPAFGFIRLASERPIGDRAA